jgi:hypothetical protein
MSKTVRFTRADDGQSVTLNRASIHYVVTVGAGRLSTMIGGQLRPRLVRPVLSRSVSQRPMSGGCSARGAGRSLPNPAPERCHQVTPSPPGAAAPTSTTAPGRV